MVSLRRVIVAAVVVAVLVVGGVVAAYYAGILGAPTAGVEDQGDWGDVSRDRVEIVTSLWVNNPNPIGIAAEGSVDVSYDLSLNGVALADGRKDGITIRAGNNSVETTTNLRSERIPEWWVAFVRNNETIPVRAQPGVTVEAGPVTVSPPLPTYNRTLLADSTPVIDGISGAVNEIEGNYTRTLSAQAARDRFGPGRLPDDFGDRVFGDAAADDLTVGYEVRDASARWGPVDESQTTVYVTLDIHNPSEEVKMPAAPDRVGATVAMNDVELFEAQANDTSLDSPESLTTIEGSDERFIAPNETEQVTYVVRMDNERVDEWFRSHVRRGERSEVRVEFQLVFADGSTTYRLPADSDVGYTCQLQTAILVDGQATETTCGQSESVGVETDNRTTATPTPTATATPTDDGSLLDDAETVVPTVTDVPTVPGRTDTPTPEDPTAQVDANRTEGSAPLPVAFDGSGSSDPDGDIERHVWYFGDGTTETGEQVTHTFRTVGSYDVRLVVFDGAGNQDTATVTITVDPRSP